MALKMTLASPDSLMANIRLNSILLKEYDVTSHCFSCLWGGKQWGGRQRGGEQGEGGEG